MKFLNPSSRTRRRKCKTITHKKTKRRTKRRQMRGG